MKESRVYLSNPTYILGRPAPVLELPELCDSSQALPLLRSADSPFRTYLKLEADPFTVAEQVVSALLEQLSIDPKEIEAIFLCSDSLGDVLGRARRTGELLEKLGLSRAYPFCVTLSECSNFQAGLRLARAMLSSGEFGRAIVASVDKAELASPRTRIVPPGISVMSDAAAACLLSTSDDDGYEILSQSQQVSPLLLRGVGTDLEQMLERASGHRRLFAQLFKGLGPLPGDLRQVFSSNFHPSVVQTYLRDNGVSDGKFYQGNLRRTAHCLSSDELINLSDFASQHEIQEGDCFLLLGSGPSQWGATLLRANTSLCA